MHHHFFTLRPHADVAKFEFEDGVIRHAAAQLLAEESAIRHLLVDLPTERVFSADVELASPDWEGSILVSSTEPDVVDPNTLAGLVIDVASIVSHRPVDLIDFSDLDATWVGSATPGPKVSFAVQSGGGIDTASFTSWLRDMLGDVVEKVPGIGCRAIAPAETSESSLTDALLSFWFPDDATLANASASNVFDPIMNAGLIEAGSARVWSTIEHRMAPNPNAWDMPTGRIMPVQDDDAPES